jgi:pseudaminic acid synthase
MKIKNVEIGRHAKPYVIAEMSGNHLGSLEKAKELLEKCALAKVSAFKIQTYSAESLTYNSTRKDYVVTDGPWNGKTLYELYSQGQTPVEWIEPLIQLGESLGVPVFSSPFSLKDVEILEKLQVPAYKIASFEITYDQLLRRIGETGKPVIFSTGLAKLSEIDRAFRILKESGAEDVAILKCTTCYPASPDDLNLETIRFLSQKYPTPIGFSDHTEGSVAALCAIAMGASIIEKHVKLDEDLTSVDSSFSLPVSELPQFVSDCNTAYNSVGVIQDGPTVNEIPYLRYRRSIIANKKIEKGIKVTLTDFSIVRPMIGLDPSYLEGLEGRTTKVEIEPGQGVTNEMFMD